MTEMEYAELHCHSYFSLLDGASSPEALVARAKELGLAALALTDHASLAGAVRFWKAAQAAELHAVIGAEVALEAGTSLTLLAENQRGYANLCRLLTIAHVGASSPAPLSLSPEYPLPTEHLPVNDEELAWPGKTEPILSWDALATHHEGLLVLAELVDIEAKKGTLPSSGPRTPRPGVLPGLRLGEGVGGEAALTRLGASADGEVGIAECLRAVFGKDRLWIELQHHRGPHDDSIIRASLDLARRLDLRCVAANDIHYATPREARLHHALVAIRHNQSLTEARRAGRLPLNHTYELASPAAMARRFAAVPAAVHASVELARRCSVSLDFSQRRLPVFCVPDGRTEFTYLYELCHAGLPRRYPQLRPAVLKQLAHELSVIEQAGLAGYFLTVWDIVRFAREREIRCQGRGSAANSLVAYLLGITSVDPLAHNLLFERFLSSDRYTIPDIDLDFAADRREEVIQYVYERYGASHAAMVCNVVTYRARSAVRDLGKALDFPLAVVDRLAKTLDSHSCVKAAAELLQQIESEAAQPPGAQPAVEASAAGRESLPAVPPEESLPPLSAHPLRLLAELLVMIDECPRHLSIHTGGMLITGPPLDEVVPLERATMPGRVVCQWNKDSVEDAGLIKIDLLGLRTLGLISGALAGIQSADPARPAPDLECLPLDDPEIFAMLQRADTIGAFQVESRAQQQMLPRLKPECFADIVIEVAIVRPGPIQGGAVHPYLRRRSGEESVSYLHPCLEPVLAETLGVLLFQEQAIRVAMVAASFSPGEADMLRRAMSRARSFEAMAAVRERFVAGAQSNGIDAETAGAIFHQLEGFAGFGFCKSHAASFALIAWQTLHLKRYYPADFYCALLNQQPMGFYAPEVIIGDAKRHGVTLLPPDINRSLWAYTVERSAPPEQAVHGSESPARPQEASSLPHDGHAAPPERDVRGSEPRTSQQLALSLPQDGRPTLPRRSPRRSEPPASYSVTSNLPPDGRTAQPGQNVRGSELRTDRQKAASLLHTVCPTPAGRSEARKEHPSPRLRMGLRAIGGLGEHAWERIRAARAAGPFTSLRDCCVRTALPQSTIADLIRAGALDALGERRSLLWQLGDIDYRPDELPLVLSSLAVDLPALEPLEKTEWEYELLGLSPHVQLMHHYRAALNRAGILSTVEVKQQPNGRAVRVGGMVAVKQRPPTAKGIVFISLEDELGMLDLVVKPQVYERYRSLLRGRTFILVAGEVQRSGRPRAGQQEASSLLHGDGAAPPGKGVLGSEPHIRPQEASRLPHDDRTSLPKRSRTVPTRRDAQSGDIGAGQPESISVLVTQAIEFSHA